MNTTQIVAVIVAMTFVVLVILSRRSGPSVTTIETRRDDDGTPGE